MCGLQDFSDSPSPTYLELVGVGFFWTEGLGTGLDNLFSLM